MAKSYKILIVEDEQELSDAYKTILEKGGYSVDLAHDGTEALDLLHTQEPDLILLDLRMPRMNGLEFLKKYDLGKHPSVKVIVFSNLDTQKEIDEAYDLGASKYMLKALASPKELIRIVEEILKSDSSINVKR